MNTRSSSSKNPTPERKPAPASTATSNNAHQAHEPETPPAQTIDPSLSEETEDTDQEYALNHWDGNLPQPQGDIAKILAQQSVRSQQLATMEHFEHIQDGTWTLATLQERSQPQPFLLAMPLSHRKLRVVYGLGTAHKDDERYTNSPIEGKAMALFGEFEHHTAVEVLQLPGNMLELASMQFLDKDQMEQERLKTGKVQKARKYFLGSHSKGKDYAALPRVVPIPAYLVYDCFEEDMDAMVIYERVLQAHGRLECHCRRAFSWILQFIQASMTKIPQDHNSVFLPDHVFGRRLHRDSHTWRNHRMAQLFPTLVDPPPEATANTIPATPIRDAATRTVPLPATPPATGGPPATPPSGNIVLSSEQFFRLLEKFGSTAAPAPTGTVTASGSSVSDTTASGDDDSDTLGINELFYHKLLAQCGLTISEKEDIPELWKKLGVQGLTKTEKLDIIREALGGRLKYRGRRIPLLPTILTTIRDRAFEGQKGGSAIAATKGLSPFAVPSLTSTEVDQLTEHAGALAEASSTSVSDVAATKIKPRAPDSFGGCLAQLQTFGNVLDKIFGDLCPLLIALDSVIDELEEFTDLERGSYSKQSFASILWVVMLQSREFASGKMPAPTTLLPEFQLLLNNLKTRIPVLHGGVPTELYHSTTSSTAGTFAGSGGAASGKTKRDLDKTGEAEPKKKRKTAAGVILKHYEADRSDMFHHHMRKAMGPFLTADPRPTVRQLCSAAGCTNLQLFPDHPKLCLRAQLFGACDKKCKHEHKKVDDNVIATAISALQPAFDASAKVLKEIKV